MIAPHRDDQIALELVYDLDPNAPNDPVAVLERLGRGAQPNAIRLIGRHRDYELHRASGLPEVDDANQGRLREDLRQRYYRYYRYFV